MQRGALRGSNAKPSKRPRDLGSVPRVKQKQKRRRSRADRFMRTTNIFIYVNGFTNMSVAKFGKWFSHNLRLISVFMPACIIADVFHG